ncbi:glycosyltransferase [Akkermansiaceae bacterium]|nr:glycosyltransferase [Akkermansiaceae bacterium]
MKPLYIISCPIDTYSGYGARSRDVVKAIIELDKYDVKILPQRWGNTPWGFIEDHKEEWEFLTPHLLPPGNSLPAKPKIWSQITVPNEFQPIGEYNVGFTAGIETTICSPDWIEGLNRMDLNIVSSQHAKEVFENTKYNKEDNQGNSIGEVFLKKPIEVLFEGADLTKYFPLKETNKFDLSDIKEKFAFLSVGHWMQGDLGEDRKNIGLLIKAFYETFKDQKSPPALILKSSGSGCSYIDRDQILNKIYSIKQTIEASILPNIYLLHGELTDKEMNDLYNHKKVKAMVSLTKGEGFGRPLLEFSLTKKPIIASNWSGHLDFLDPKFTSLISGELTNVHPSAVVKNMILKESKWFSPHPPMVSKCLHSIFNDYKKYEKGATLQYHKSKNSFSFEKMKESFENIYDIYVPNFPSTVELNLPKLNLPKLENV